MNSEISNEVEIMNSEISNEVEIMNNPFPLKFILQSLIFCI